MSPRPAPAPAPPPPPPERAEDAASQALSEALRSSFFIVRIIMIALVVVFLGSGFFTVGTQEKAIILRLGKPVAEDESALLGPGAHWAFPYPIDEVVRIPVGQVQTVSSTIGWWLTTAALEAAGTEPEPGPTLNPAADGYVLTGDGSIVHVRGTARYRIAEPGLRFMFDFAGASNQVQSSVAGASNLVQNALNNALVHAAARSSVEITRDTTAFRERAASRLKELVDQQRLGIVVDQVSVEVRPPRQLTTDFVRVIEAGVKRDTALTEARQYANETTNRALAEARARVNVAQAERKNLVGLVAAEAKRFTDLLPEYRKDPQLFMELRYAEALQRIYTNVSERIIVQEPLAGQPRQLWLQLGREPEKVKTFERPATQGHH
jgi:membrane protease subunit HflK